MIKRPKEIEMGGGGKKVEKYKECENETRGQGSPRVALWPAEATLQ